MTFQDQPISFLNGSSDVYIFFSSCYLQIVSHLTYMVGSGWAQWSNNLKYLSSMWRFLKHLNATLLSFLHLFFPRLEIPLDVGSKAGIAHGGWQATFQVKAGRLRADTEARSFQSWLDSWEQLSTEAAHMRRGVHATLPDVCMYARWYTHMYFLPPLAEMA